MKITGFTIVRNAILYEYPVLEAISSILPLCDEFIVSVGKSEDDTLRLIEKIQSPKIKIIESHWDESKRSGGEVLSFETNKAFDAISTDTDWAFYMQSDEVIHEKYLPIIKETLLKWEKHKEVEGIVFNYLHFYGSYDYVGNSRRWYRREVRVIRNDKSIRSFRDAQGFRKNGRKLNVKPIDACVYHYGWVKHPSKQQAKQKSFNKLWHNDHWVEKNVGNLNEYDYNQIDSLQKFEETHPTVIQKRVKDQNWKFVFDASQTQWSLKSKISNWIEKISGWRLGEYKNYKII
jgi:hypothetical protein